MKAGVEHDPAFTILRMEYRVYMLRNPAGRSYIGLSANVLERLAQHNRGESRWTAKHGPWEVVWTSRAMTLSEARKLENLLKRQKGGDGMARILSDFAGS